LSESPPAGNEVIVAATLLVFRDPVVFTLA
jgi:hypothetical protein